MYKLNWRIRTATTKKGATDLFPLVNVAHEATETEQAQQAEQLDEPEHFERAAGARQLIAFAALAHQQEYVVERYGAEEVHEEPCAYVVLGYHARLEYDLVHVVILQNT